MFKFFVKFCFVVSGSFLLLACGVNYQQLPSLDLERVENFSPPKPESWVTSNGIRVIYMYDSEIPTVRANLYLKGGSLNLLDVGPGVVNAMGEQMRDGGTVDLTPDQLNKRLELLSASIGSDFGLEFGSVSFFSLKDDVDEVFKLFADVVRKPGFDQRQLEIWRGQILESINRRKDDPNKIISLMFRQIVYPQSKYGEVLGSLEVNKINRVDLLKAHRKLVSPKDSILTVAGDISRDKLQQLIEKNFGSWKDSGVQLADNPDLVKEPVPGIYLFNFPFSQATIVAGQLGVPRFTKDYVDIDVFNEIFGTGGFSSRLMEYIRVKGGLAYSTYGLIEPGIVKGRNYFMIQTKSESAAAATEIGLDVLDRLQNELVSEVELNEVQDAVLNSFIFRFESTDKLVNREAYKILLNYPKNYESFYVKRVREIVPADIENVAKSRWDFNKFVYIVVGNQTTIDSIKLAVNKEGTRLYGLPVYEPKYSQELLINKM